MTALVDAAELAAVLGVTRGYVYEHADELGAVRLGSGPRARLRFDVADALERLGSCSTSRESEVEKPVTAPVRRRRSRAMGTDADLLPVRGSRGAS